MNKNAWNIEVKDRKTFQEFVELLLSDYKENKERWENDRLDLFIEAIGAYTDDLDGYYLNNHPEIDANKPSWRVFADIIRGAVFYE